MKIYVIAGKLGSNKYEIVKGVCSVMDDLKFIPAYTTNNTMKREGMFKEIKSDRVSRSNDKLLIYKSKIYKSNVYHYFFDVRSFSDKDKSYIIMGDLFLCHKLRDWFGSNVVKTIYVDIDGITRMSTLIKRASIMRDNGELDEDSLVGLCKSFIAEEQDYQSKLFPAKNVSRVEGKDTIEIVRDVLKVIEGEQQ